MARAHKCDACGGKRLGWQRLCDLCFPVLPGDIRSGLLQSFSHDKPRWRAFRKRARAFIADRGKRPINHPAVSPERAYALAAAITGDRD